MSFFYFPNSYFIIIISLLPLVNVGSCSQGDSIFFEPAADMRVCPVIKGSMYGMYLGSYTLHPFLPLIIPTF